MPAQHVCDWWAVVQRRSYAVVQAEVCCSQVQAHSLQALAAAEQQHLLQPLFVHGFGAMELLQQLNKQLLHGLTPVAFLQASQL